MEPDTKRCSQCKTFKTISEFAGDKYRKDGLRSICKPCDRAKSAERYRKINPDAKTQAQRREGCLIQECANPHAAKGYCKLHYSRFKRHGNPYAAGLPVTQRPQHGSNNPGWKDHKIKYGSALARVTRERGQARHHPCAECGKQASRWAYSGTDPQELAVTDSDNTALTGMRYSANPSFYRPLCRTCWASLIANR